MSDLDLRIFNLNWLPGEGFCHLQHNDSLIHSLLPDGVVTDVEDTDEEDVPPWGEMGDNSDSDPSFSDGHDDFQVNDDEHTA